jgi:hypothetical protein
MLQIFPRREAKILQNIISMFICVKEKRWTIPKQQILNIGPLAFQTNNKKIKILFLSIKELARSCLRGAK